MREEKRGRSWRGTHQSYKREKRREKGKKRQRDMKKRVVHKAIHLVRSDTLITGFAFMRDSRDVPFFFLPLSSQFVEWSSIFLFIICASLYMRIRPLFLRFILSSCRCILYTHSCLSFHSFGENALSLMFLELIHRVFLFRFFTRAAAR